MVGSILDAARPSGEVQMPVAGRAAACQRLTCRWPGLPARAPAWPAAGAAGWGFHHGEGLLKRVAMLSSAQVLSLLTARRSVCLSPDRSAASVAMLP
jgi:hypothetical protein